jgi:bacterial/archaeal transporter family-2 protein
MYKKFSLINGVILAIMVFFNGMLTSRIGPYMSTLIYYLLGLFFIIGISIVKKNKLLILRKLPIIFFLPGILGVVTILLNNIAIPQIGVTLTVGVGLFGQLAMSSLVEHFGLFGMPVNRLRKEKILGLSIISLGIVAMIVI